MTDTIGIRELLWEWSRAYPEKAGDSVNWQRLAPFARDMIADRHRENPDPINHQRAEGTDQAVLAYLNAIRRRPNSAKAEEEEKVFWLRYFYRWEMHDVARKVKRSKPWTEKKCQTIEDTVEAFYLDRVAA